MLTERSIIGSINVKASGEIEVRRDDQILRDGEVIITGYHRHVLAPGDALDGEDSVVASVAAAVWTADVIAAYQASIT
jgi:hypothetical protein